MYAGMAAPAPAAHPAPATPPARAQRGGLVLSSSAVRYSVTHLQQIELELELELEMALEDKGRQHIITGCVASVTRPAAGVNFCQPNIGCVSHLHHCHWSPAWHHTSSGCHVQVILSLSFYSVMYFRAAKYDEDCRYKSLEFSLDKTD